MSSAEEKNNQRKSMYISLGVHGALLILFFFLLAWKEPFPPIPEYGIELNFGLDESGSGNIQREEVAVTQTPTDQTSDTEETVEETEEEVVEEQTPTPADTPSENEVEEQTEAADEVVPDDIESPDVVEEQDEAVADTPSEPQPTVETSENDEEESTPAQAAGGTNQGEEEDETGDQGDPEGEIDERAIYGTPGAGGGASLNMAGWMWDYIPKPDDRSDENGRIVFAITIDDAGEILSIRTIEKTVTPAVERIYRAEVERLTFSTTSDNTRPAPTSSGTITFIIKTN